MATASEYRSAARTLDGARDRVANLLRDVPSDSFATALVGPTRAVAESAVDVTLANVRMALVQLEAQIDEAHRRAAICDAYTDAVNQYHRSDHPDRQWPTRPATWVTYG